MEIPPNTRATVRLPGASLANVSEGGQPVSGRDGIASARQGGQDAVLEIGSGVYRFVW